MVSRGKVLELLRPDEGCKMHTILATEVFGAIRCLVPFRLTGASRDYVIIGSESGRIVIVEYSKEKNIFVKVRPAKHHLIAASRLDIAGNSVWPSCHWIRCALVAEWRSRVLFEMLLKQKIIF